MLFRLLSILCFLTLLIACKNKPTPKYFKLPENKGQLTQVNFLYLTAKAKLHYQDENQSFKSAVEIRAKKDSAIWISFRPALGVEVARMLITQDSIKVLDRTKQAEYLYAMKELRHNLKFDLHFAHIEALLTGNLMYQNKPTNVSKEADYQIITQKEKSIELKNYVGNNQKIAKVSFFDTITQHKANVTYADYREVSANLFPYFSAALLTYFNQQQQATQIETTLNYQKITLGNKPLLFPF
jgi:hypothetical protein